MTDDYVVREWWLVRHAPVNTEKIYGHLDLEADFSDTRRLAEIASMLPKAGRIITSDLSRSVETARHLLMHRNSRAEIDMRSGLREQNFGVWEGKSHSEVEKAAPGLYRAFWTNPARGKVGAGESFQDLVCRVQGEMKDLLRDESSRDIVIVTHAGVIRAMIGLALEIAPEKMLALSVSPLSVAHLTSFSKNAENSWRVNFLNDIGTERTARR